MTTTPDKLPRPPAWLCELMQEDGSTRTQIVTENPDGLRWNDSGEPSPLKVTPLYEHQSPAVKVPLTDAEIAAIWKVWPHQAITGAPKAISFARAVEAAHGITATTAKG